MTCLPDAAGVAHKRFAVALLLLPVRAGCTSAGSSQSLLMPDRPLEHECRTDIGSLCTVSLCDQCWACCVGIGDLERAVARIAATCADAVARDADAVVLYEDAAKRRVQAFVAALRGLQSLQVHSYN